MELIIDKEIDNKIKYLCNKINTVEWGGLVLYVTEGTIADPDNMKFILKDIIPMDKGTGGATEYKIHTDTSDKHMDYCFKHPEALEWRIGGIHSHQAMAVFFSSTDTNELKENAKRHNLYLSIVVNNAHNIIAKVVQAVYGESFIKTFVLNENGRKEELEAKTEDVYDLRQWDLKVILPESEQVSDEFKEAVDKIIEEAKPKSFPDYFKSSYDPHTYKPWGSDYFDSFDNGYETSRFPSWASTAGKEDKYTDTIDDRFDNLICELLGEAPSEDGFLGVVDDLEADKDIDAYDLLKRVVSKQPKVFKKYAKQLNYTYDELCEEVYNDLKELYEEYGYKKLGGVVNYFSKIINRNN